MTEHEIIRKITGEDENFINKKKRENPVEKFKNNEIKITQMMVSSMSVVSDMLCMKTHLIGLIAPNKSDRSDL